MFTARYGLFQISATLMIAAIGVALTAVPVQLCAADNGDEEFVVAIAQTELRFWESPEDFADHMSRRVTEAMEHEPDLIVFPEDIGLPLIALGDLDALEEAGSVEDAIGALLLRHLDEVAAIVAAHEVSPMRALWLEKDPVMSETYRETFSVLARENAVHIIAGSTPMVLPDRPADSFNTACLFDPDGEMHVVGTKVNLIPIEREDGLDLSPGALEDYRVFRTPKAVVGTIVCADGWAPEIARALVDQGAQVLVQVSANPEEWTETAREGWQDSLFSRVQELEVYGVCVMGVGNLLGLPFEGQSSVLAPREWTEDGSGFLAETASATEEELLVITLDLSRIGRD